MARRRDPATKLDRIPVRDLLRAAGDRFGIVVRDRWGTVSGLILTLVLIAGWIIENAYGPWRPDPEPFFYLNLIMSAAATVTVPLFIIVDKVQSRRDAGQIAELRRAIDHLSRLIEQKVRP